MKNIWTKKTQLGFKVGDWVTTDASVTSIIFKKPVKIIEIRLEYSGACTEPLFWIGLLENASPVEWINLECIKKA